MTPLQLVSLSRSVQARQIRLAANTSQAVGDLWDSLPGIGDRELVSFSRDAASLVNQAQEVSARHTVAYLAQAEGLPVVGSGVSISEVVADSRSGVSAVAVYERPVVTARAALAGGKSFAEARALGRIRATSAADTDITLASRGAARSYATSPRSRITGYRRMPNGGACDFCLMASTQRYRIGDLMPIHTNCHCIPPVPIIGKSDPGRVINKDLLRELKSSGRAGDLSYQGGVRRANDAVKLAEQRLADLQVRITETTSREDVLKLRGRQRRWEARKEEFERNAASREKDLAEYRERRRDPSAGYRELVTVQDHGELGPVLTRKGNSFARI